MSDMAWDDALQKTDREFKLIIPKCQVICYNISLYQTLCRGRDFACIDWHVEMELVTARLSGRFTAEKYEEKPKEIKIISLYNGLKFDKC